MNHFRHAEQARTNKGFVTVTCESLAFPLLSPPSTMASKGSCSSPIYISDDEDENDVAGQLAYTELDSTPQNTPHHTQNQLITVSEPVYTPSESISFLPLLELTMHLQWKRVLSRDPPFKSASVTTHLHILFLGPAASIPSTKRACRISRPKRPENGGGGWSGRRL